MNAASRFAAIECPKKWKKRIFWIEQRNCSRVYTLEKQLSWARFVWHLNHSPKWQHKTTDSVFIAFACIFNRIQTICPRDFLPKRLLYNNDLCVLFYQSTTENIRYFILHFAELSRSLYLSLSDFRLSIKMCSVRPSKSHHILVIQTTTKMLQFLPFIRDNWRTDTNCRRWRHVLEFYWVQHTSDMNRKWHFSIYKRFRENFHFVFYRKCACNFMVLACSISGRMLKRIHEIKEICNAGNCWIFI